MARPKKETTDNKDDVVNKRVDRKDVETPLDVKTLDATSPNVSSGKTEAVAASEPPSDQYPLEVQLHGRPSDNLGKKSWQEKDPEMSEEGKALIKGAKPPISTGAGRLEMVKVKVLNDRHPTWNGRKLEKDETEVVDAATAQKWLDEGIASLA